MSGAVALVMRLLYMTTRTSKTACPDPLYGGTWITLIVIVFALAFTFVTVWLLIFLYSPSSMRGEQGENSFYYSDVRESLTTSPRSSATTGPISSSRREGPKAEELASSTDQVR
jgi:hypothetical protein